MPIPEPPVNPWDAMEAELKDCLTLVWPEVGVELHPIFRSTDAQRRSYLSELEQGDLKTPWVVYWYENTAQAHGWGACNVVYNPTVVILYIVEDDGQEEDTAKAMREKLWQLQHFLTTRATQAFQLMPFDFKADVSDQNEGNSVFLPANISLFAGSLSFPVLFGYIPGPTVAIED